MITPDLVVLVDEGLGNSTYLVDLGAGRGLVVDPSRDLRAVRAAAAVRGLRLAFAADTHLPGARHVELGAVAGHAARLPERPTVVMCGHGERAMSAASLLARAGHRQLTVLTGGPDDWSAATGRPLQAGT